MRIRNLFQKKREPKTRNYGGTRTIHRTGWLDVEVDSHGQVVAVWFRCLALPFKQSNVDTRRAGEMRGMYQDARYTMEIESINVTELEG